MTTFFNIWSKEHQAYWARNQTGYVETQEEAGQYALEEASEICRNANQHTLEGEGPEEVMVPLKKPTYNAWKLKDGRVIYLLTVAQLRALPDGATICSIVGKERTKHDSALGAPDEDTRGGFTAWGLKPN